LLNFFPNPRAAAAKYQVKGGVSHVLQFQER
jgi:hypothetical protein